MDQPVGTAVLTRWDTPAGDRGGSARSRASRTGGERPRRSATFVGVIAPGRPNISTSKEHLLSRPVAAAFGIDRDSSVARVDVHSGVIKGGD